MSVQFTMSKKCVLLRDIKTYLKKLECGQLEIEAGQWELHKDIMTMRKMFDDLKNLKENFEEMKKNNLKQMEAIRKLESALSQQRDDISPKKESNSHRSDEILGTIDKRVLKNGNKDPKKKTHVVHSEEIIEITSHLESNTSKSASNIKSEAAEERKGKRKGEGKTYLRSPIRSIVYVRKHTSGSGKVKTKIRVPPKKKDNAMLQRYLIDSAKYVDKKKSEADVEASKSGAISKESSRKEVEDPGKADSWACINTKPRFSNSRGSDRSTERYSMTDNPETVLPKSVPPVKKRKSLFMTYIDSRSKRRKKNPTYACGVCERRFYTKDLLRAHELVHVKMLEKSKIYKCNYCNNVYQSPEFLEKHARKCQLIRSFFGRVDR